MRNLSSRIRLSGVKQTLILSLIPFALNTAAIETGWTAEPDVRVRHLSCLDLTRAAPQTPAGREADRHRGSHFRIFAESARGRNWRSKMIRDNPEHWWAEMRRLVDSGTLGSALRDLEKYHGFVMGDSHPGNYLFTRRDGRVVVSSYDEGGGTGPYILDFARLVMTTKAIFRGRDFDGDDVKISELVEAYVKGLEGRRLTMDDQVREEMDRVSDEYEASREAQIYRALNGKGQFRDRTSLDEMEKSEMDSLRSALARQAGLKLIDGAWKSVERGASAELKRVRISVRDPSDDAKISFLLMELKPMERSDLASYARQSLSNAERFRLMQRWQARDEDEKWDQLISWQGETFWLRIKKPNVFELPYRLRTEEDVDLISSFAEHVAYTMGRAHAAQAGRRYVRAVSSRQDDLRAAIKDLSRTYIKKVEGYAESYWDKDWEPRERVR